MIPATLYSNPFARTLTRLRLSPVLMMSIRLILGSHSDQSRDGVFWRGFQWNRKQRLADLRACYSALPGLN